MLIIENIILAINSLLSNKMRALLTMLGIIIGIGSVIAIITVGDSLTLSVSENMQSMGANDVYVTINPRDSEVENASIEGATYGTLENSNVMPSDEDYITNDMIRDLSNKFQDEIYAINLQYSVGSGNIELNNKNANVSVYGVSAGYFITNELTILGGHMFSQTDFEEGKNVTIVSDKLVENIFDGDINKAIGSEIQTNVNNKIGNFTIIGVYENQDMYMMGMSMGTNSATDMYIPLKSTTAFESGELKYEYMQIITKVGVDSDKLVTKITNYFEPYYSSNRNYEIRAFTMGSMVSMLTDMLSTITLAISIVAGIALIVGGIGVMNIMLVSVTERTREIGTRKALGAKNSSIRTQFIVEAMIICLIGGMIGVILGIGGGVLASNLLGYPAKPSVSGIIISLIFSMSIGVFFGYYPANKAAKMNPIDALRYE